MRYPYYINPDIDSLASAEGEERIRLMRHIAANVGDEAALRAIIGIDPQEFRNFYPDMNPPALSTEDTISSFIDRFASEKQAETPQIEEIIAAPVVDYASMLADKESDEESDLSDATSEAIDSFLEAVPPKTPGKPRPRAAAKISRDQYNEVHDSDDKNRTQNNGAEDSLPKGELRKDSEEGLELSESLFKLMVKNKNYAKALEIINEISLNNPKKSIYFAYQKRFLEKLIKINSQKQEAQ